MPANPLAASSFCSEPGLMHSLERQTSGESHFLRWIRVIFARPSEEGLRHNWQLRQDGHEYSSEALVGRENVPAAVLKQ